MTLDKSLIAMDLLQEALETAFYTAPVRGTIPTSIMLIGLPGTGKSKAILQFNAPSIHVTNDVTSSGLCEVLENDKTGALRHLVIPDFNIVVNHRQSTSSLTIATLLTVMSEGIARVDDGRRKKEIVHAPIGIITAMTREVYEQHAKKFSQLGIGRRFCYMFFGYSFITRDKVQTEIASGSVSLQQLLPRNLILPKHTEWPLTIVIKEQEAMDIRLFSQEMASNLSYQPRWVREEDSFVIKPFRGASPVEFTPHMVLRTMAQGHALRAGRMIVNHEDLEFLKNFVSFTNYALPVQL
jgi:hypothetical protein